MVKDVWEEIKSHKGTQCADCMEAWYREVDTGIFQLEDIVEKSDCQPDCVERAVDIMVSKHLISRIEGYRCPYCGEEIDPEDVSSNSQCEHCEGEFSSGVDSLETYPKYKVEKIPKRDVEWVITIHGMNTNGAWQEEFSWRIATMYGYSYSIPVSIFKYGNIKVGALLYLRRAKRVRKFAESIRRRQEQSGRGKPDVIAHSYGTLLLGELLKSGEYRDIEFGRVILTGSIVEPSFKWNEVINRGQIEAVLCHYSDKDIPVRLAQFTIPGSGPSGHIGFDQRGSVVHVHETDFGHSDYFLEKHNEKVLHSIWEPFLTSGDVMPDWKGTDYQNGEWSPSRLRYFTHAWKIILLFGLGVFLFLVIPVSIWKGWSEAIFLIFSSISIS